MDKLEVHGLPCATALVRLVVYKSEVRRRAGADGKSRPVAHGHSSIQVTFDTYGHLFPSVDEAAEMAAA